MHLKETDEQYFEDHRNFFLSTSNKQHSQVLINCSSDLPYYLTRCVQNLKSEESLQAQSSVLL